ncbi:MULTISPECIES: YkvA family protein [Pseudomonas]|uniref:YkvA family protein n=1 Tax=Pseudomonas TaxID=286 RepID=UPI000CFB25EA|nr:MULTISPECIES: YkvA family protein [Pseudomonas]PQZ93121.1 hypothetical protein CQ048_05790 [Pseudomonas trivialis]PRB28442.1 hypothetical protein CQ041_05795 [Pseudomonas sp. MYb60]
MITAAVRRLKSWAKTLKTKLILLWLCCRQLDMPLSAKAVALTTVVYALSPIDLIPDFIPVLGLLDDVILLPLGIALALRMIPVQLLQRCHLLALAKAGQRISLKGTWLMTGGILIVWLIAIAFALSAFG